MCSGNVGSRMTMFDAIYDREQKALLCGNPDCKAFLTRNVKEDCCRPGAAVAPRDACESAFVLYAKASTVVRVEVTTTTRLSRVV